MKWVFGVFIVGVLIVLSYFAFRTVSPISQARADEIQIQAQQRAADQELERQQQEAINRIQLAERAARSAQVQQSWTTFTRWTGRIFTLAVFVSLTALTLSFVRFSSGRANAAVERAELEAQLVYPDKETGLLPVKFTITEDGHLFATNLGTGQTLQLDMPHEPNAQLAAGFIAVSYAQAIARLAAKTDDGGIQANIETPVIHPQMIDLESLTHLLEQQERKDDNA